MSRWTGVGVAAALWLGAAVGTGRAETVNRIVAVVNDQVITQADVELTVSDLLEGWQEERQAPPPSSASLHEAVLQRLIDRQLMLQEARHLELTVTGEEVADRLDLLRARAGSEAAFQETLARSGLASETLKARVREDLLIRKVIDQKVRSTISVSPQEVSMRLTGTSDVPGVERARARHILIRMTPERSEEAARRTIQRLYDEAQRGADFAALAREQSDDPHAAQGGDLGWVARGQLMPELDSALFSLEPGQVSAPIQTRLGFHLVRVEERDAGGASALAANTVAYHQVYEEKYQAALERWVRSLREQAYIEVHLPGS